MLRKLRGNQKGFTLIEVIVAIALTGIIGAAAVMSIHQVFTGTALSSDLNTAINNVSNAGYWISRDIQMAQPGLDNIQCGDDAGTSDKYELLRLKWTDLDESGFFVTQNYEITYYFESDSGIQDLHREYVPPISATEHSIVARYIDSGAASCAYSGTGAVAVTITASYHDITKTRVYRSTPRRSF